MFHTRITQWIKVTAASAVIPLCLVIACNTSRKGDVKTTEGFDFTCGGSVEEESWAGPQIGESIDLTRLKDRHGTPLISAVEHEFCMVALIDPECAAAKAALDQLTGVRAGIAKEGIPYYPISLVPSTAEIDFFTYADSLKLGDAFLWRKSEPAPPGRLFSMVLPSHLLLTKKGTVVRKWPGTSPSKLNRARMVNQIVSDTLHELQRPKS